MVSVERIQEYQDHLEKEAPYLMPEQDPSSDWPQHGEVCRIVSTMKTNEKMVVSCKRSSSKIIRLGIAKALTLS